MRIRELTLWNFRGHAHKSFGFGDRFTVIAGINGRGKTAILDALASSLSRFLPLVTPARGRPRPIRRSDVAVGAMYTQLVASIRCADVPLTYTVLFDGSLEKTAARGVTPAVAREIRQRYAAPTGPHRRLPIAVYYGTDRAGYRLPARLPSVLPNAQSAAYQGALSNKVVNFRDFIGRIHSGEVLDQERRRMNPDYLGNRAVSAISRALTIFLDGFTGLRVLTDPLRLVVDKRGQRLSLTQLSDGERALLAVVCDLGRRLALANPEHPNPLEGSGVVLIDELELHLHPNWQRGVVEKLRFTFPNIQFIGTTHSPFVIQSLRPGELISLDPEEFQGTQERADGKAHEPDAEYSDKSIEDIAEHVLKIKTPQKSRRYLEMMAAAEKYFGLLRSAGRSEVAAADAKRAYDELAVRYSDDPAYQALLRVEREFGRHGEGNEAG